MVSTTVRLPAHASSKRFSKSWTGVVRMQFKPENQLLRRKIHPRSTEHFSLRCPSLDWDSISDTLMRLTSWRRQSSEELLVCEWMFRWVGGNSYTLGMDSVRFGRVLGIGARLAAKTMVSRWMRRSPPNPSAAETKQGTGGGPVAGSSSTTAEKAKASGAGWGKMLRERRHRCGRLSAG